MDVMQIVLCKIMIQMLYDEDFSQTNVVLSKQGVCELMFFEQQFLLYV
jgi:hypothetical protein